MPATTVQQNNGATNATTSLTVTLAAGTTSGNWLLIGVVSDAAATSTGFAQDATVAHATTGKATLLRKATTAGETSWTVTITGSSYGGAWWVAEVSGLLAASPLDQTATNASGLNTGTTATTTAADELAVAMVCATSNSGAVTFSAWTNSFVEQADRSTTAVLYQCLGVATRDLSATGAYTTAATASTTPPSSFGLMATYKLAPAAVAPPPPARINRIRHLIVR